MWAETSDHPKGGSQKGKSLTHSGSSKVDSSGRFEMAITLNLLCWDLFSVRATSEADIGMDSDDRHVARSVVEEEEVEEEEGRREEEGSPASGGAKRTKRRRRGSAAESSALGSSASGAQATKMKHREVLALSLATQQQHLQEAKAARAATEAYQKEMKELMEVNAAEQKRHNAEQEKTSSRLVDVLGSLVGKL